MGYKGKRKPIYRGGVNRRSQLEAIVTNNLDARGAKYRYEAMKIPYVLECNYIPDLILDNGIIVEIKGLFDQDDRRKHLAVKDSMPDLDIRFCFGNANNKLYKGSKTSYADWCAKNGFQWCEKLIPQSWLEEKKGNKT